MDHKGARGIKRNLAIESVKFLWFLSLVTEKNMDRYTAHHSSAVRRCSDRFWGSNCRELHPLVLSETENCKPQLTFSAIIVRILICKTLCDTYISSPTHLVFIIALKSISLWTFCIDIGLFYSETLLMVSVEKFHLLCACG